MIYCNVTIGVICGSPPTVTNAVFNSTNISQSYNSTITYRCLVGFWFLPGIYSHLSTCQYNATWTYVLPCVGK